MPLPPPPGRKTLTNVIWGNKYEKGRREKRENVKKEERGKKKEKFKLKDKINAKGAKLKAKRVSAE
jgi:hypothetical protein